MAVPQRASAQVALMWFLKQLRVERPKHLHPGVGEPELDRANPSPLGQNFQLEVHLQGLPLELSATATPRMLSELDPLAPQRGASQNQSRAKQMQVSRQPSSEFHTSA